MSNKIRKLEPYSPHKQVDIAYSRMCMSATKIGKSYAGQTTDCTYCMSPLNLEHVLFGNNNTCPQFKTEREEMEAELLKTGLTNINLDTILFPPSKNAGQIRHILFNFLQQTELINKI